MNITYITAFTAGFITFFASCLAPLTPAFIAFLSSQTHTKSRYKYVLPTLTFVFGFLLIFLLFGLSAGVIGNQFNQYRYWGNILGGVFLIILGLHTAQILKLKILFREFRFTTLFHTRFPLINAFLFGLTFGFAWTPCIGPVLAGILFLAANTPDQAIILLLLFGTGMSVPYILLAIFFQKISPFYAKSGRLGHYVQIASGLFLLAVGIALLTGKLNLITIAVSRFLNLYTLTL